ncbi:MAG: hypothetical protein QGD95_07980 [Actinomycetota bacterium]|nr:hypothetical protein [Actinomycetota bacterium]
MVIPFYGVDNREMFEIEREAMDRPGKVVEALNAILPDEGVILDIGAGDGFTGQRLATPGRTIVGIEPDSRSTSSRRRSCSTRWMTLVCCLSSSSVIVRSRRLKSSTASL